MVCLLNKEIYNFPNDSFENFKESLLLYSFKKHYHRVLTSRYRSVEEYRREYRKLVVKGRIARAAGLIQYALKRPVGYLFLVGISGEHQMRSLSTRALANEVIPSQFATENYSFFLT